MVVISIVHILPATALHDAYLDDIYGWRNIVIIFVYDVFWYTAVIKLAMMALNRFVSIVYPMEYKVWFSKRNTMYMIAFVYLIGLGTFYVIRICECFRCESPNPASVLSYRIQPHRVDDSIPPARQCVRVC